jgi:hypothetical protein
MWSGRGFLVSRGSVKSSGGPNLRPQTVPMGDQHHGGIPAAIAVALGGVDQPLDLGLCQMLAGAKLRIRPPARRHCSLRWLARPDKTDWQSRAPERFVAGPSHRPMRRRLRR